MSRPVGSDLINLEAFMRVRGARMQLRQRLSDEEIERAATKVAQVAIV